MEKAALIRSALLRNIISSLEQPLDPSRTAAMAQQLVDSGLLIAAPDGVQGVAWAAVTELQVKLVEQLLKHITKGEAPFRPSAAVLLGLVCCYVPVRAFLASYGEWSAALLDLVRRDSGAASRATGLRALGDLFIRVREVLDVPGVRRDASGIAGRTLQVATPLLTDPDCQTSALAAVTSVLQALPTVARNHTVPLERSLAGLMAAPASKPAVRSGAAAALALLPRAAADDAAAWSTLTRRVLLSLHTALDLLLYHGGVGLSALTGGGGGGSAAATAAPDGGLGERAREHLEAVGLGVADAEGLLGSAGFVSVISGGGGGSTAAATAATTARPDVALTVQVTVALLRCLVVLVGRGSASPVPVPTHALLLLVMRMLKVDATVLLAPGRVAPSASAQSVVLALLPDLHVSGWELLDLTARITRSTMMPLMAMVCRTLNEHLRRIKAGGAGGLAVVMPAAVRTSLYRTTVTVLRIGGFAAGRYLAAEVVGMLVTELYGISAAQQQEQSKASLYGSGSTAGGHAVGFGGRAPGGPASAAGMLVQPAKKSKTAGDPLAGFDAAAAAAAAAAIAPVASPSDVEAQVAALEVAEALMQVYGPALTADLRGQLDALSYHMAAVLTEAAYHIATEQGAAAAARAADVVMLRVAATRALVASLAAPWPSRHPFLSDGLKLLSVGASGSDGVALAKVCTEGLLALEALLRPRSAPLLTPARAAAAGVGGSAAAADATGSLQLPRPRLWSMLDPVQSQPPTPVAAAAAAETTKAAGAASGAQAMEVCPDEGDDSESGERLVLNPGGLKAAPAEAAPTPQASGKDTTIREKGVKGKVKRDGKPPAIKEPTPGDPAKKGAHRRQKGMDTKAAAAASDAMEVDVVDQSAAAVAASGPKAIGTPVPLAAKPTTPPAAPSAAPVARAAPMAPLATATAAAAAAAFSGESEDSEGSLPEIDSGDDSGDSDDE